MRSRSMIYNCARRDYVRCPHDVLCANTHWDWFSFLRSRRDVWDEVNFWTPSDYYAFHGTSGSPFFFRLMSPRNAIGGFGYVAGFSKLPEYMAWEWFGEGNGADSFAKMKGRLDAIRTQNAMQGRAKQKQIGCIILSSAVFFPEDLWIPQPSDWGRYIGRPHVSIT